MGILDNILDGMKDKAEELKDKAGDLMDDVKERAEGIKDKAEDIVDDVKGKAAPTLDTVKDKAEDVVEAIKSKAGDFAEIFDKDAPTVEIKNDFFASKEAEAKEQLAEAARKADAFDAQMKEMMAKMQAEKEEPKQEEE